MTGDEPPTTWLTRRQGLWLLAVLFTPLSVTATALALTGGEGDPFIWFVLVGGAVITVVVDARLVVELRRDRRRSRGR